VSGPARSSLATDSVYNGLGFLVRASLTVLGMAWVARVLGPEDQGRFGFAHWAGTIAAQAALVGLTPATMRFVAHALGGGREGEAAGVVALTRARLVRHLAIVTPLALLGGLAFGGDLRWPLVLAALYPLTLATYQWRVAVAWGLRRFDIAFRGHLVFFAVLLPGFGVALACPHPVLGVLLATVVARAVHAASVWRWTDLLPPAEPLAPALRDEVHRYAWQMAAVALTGALLWERSELAVLKAWAPWADVGIYTAAFGLSALVINVPSVLAVVLVPFVAGLQGAERGGAVGEAFGRGARLLTLALAGPTAVATVAAPALVEVVYGADYAAAAAPLQVLLLPLVLGGFGGAGSKTMIGSGDARLLFRIEASAVVLKLALALALVPTLGAMGAAIGCAFGQGAALLGAGVAAGLRFGSPRRRWPRQAAVVAAAALGAGVGGLVEGSSAAVLAAQIGGGAAGWIGAAALLRPLFRGDAGERGALFRAFEGG
jgi:O-antigen/teichoic acid export membrane protein